MRWRFSGTYRDWTFGPVDIMSGPAGVSIWLWLLLVTIERHPLHVSLDWNPD